MSDKLIKQTEKNHSGWVGVDLDGTLAHYDGWKGLKHIGEPVPAMLKRVLQWLDEGKEVRIFTARVSPENRGYAEALEAKEVITDWCIKHIGYALDVTYKKDLKMYQLWDDRCVCVERNTGKILGANKDEHH